MKKENALFIGFDLLLGLAASIFTTYNLFFCISAREVPLFIVPLIFLGICGISGSSCSLFLIMKNNICLKKYIIPYIVSIIICAGYYIVSHKFIVMNSIYNLLLWIPIIVLLLFIIWGVKNVKERIILILSSPVIYWVLFWEMFTIAFLIDE